ncbi:hypothetical protein [Flavobacterium sp.]|jgi:hypothetical protein|uniref:hypothetical protein n=1 Tax=Flavobacterium sp. TaxID=239 RepID=UPI0037BFCE44
MGYTPKDKLTKVHIGDKGLIAKLPKAPKITGKSSGKAVVSKVYAAPLSGMFEQAQIEVTSDRQWGDVSIDFYEWPLDTANLSDIYAKLVGKSLSSTANSQGFVLYKASTKVIAESFTKQERVSKSGTKVLSETFSKSDVFSRVFIANRSFTETKSFVERLVLSSIKDVRESFSYTEQVQRAPNKVLVDSVSKSDYFSRVVTFNRSFNDFIDATDDFYGAMNVDDDQVAWVNKILVENKTIEEVFSKIYSKPVTEVHTTSVAEEKRLSLTKVRFDSTTNSEQRTVLLNKALLEVKTFVENFTKNLSKVVEELFSISDRFSVLISKPLYDSLYSSDFLTNDTIKSIIETFRTSESFVKAAASVRLDTLHPVEYIEKAFTTAIADLVSQSDTIGKHVKLKIEEIDYFLQDYVFEDYTYKIVHLFDGITDFKIYKSLVDTVDATDDFYGETNVDDDQVASVAKSLSETFNKSDVFSRVFVANREITDYSTFSEHKTFNIAKVLLETKYTSEIISKVASKIFVDSDTVSETIYKTPAKVLLENFATAEYKTFSSSIVKADVLSLPESLVIVTSKVLTATSTLTESVTTQVTSFRSFEDSKFVLDALNKLITKGVTDSVIKSESYSAGTNKVLLETKVLQEALICSFSKVFNDLVDATDDFYGETNVDDDQVALVVKTLSDSRTISDMFNKTVIFVRSFVEQSVTSEYNLFNFGKSVLEVTSTVETLSKSLARNLTETFNKSDTVRLLLGKPFSDSVNNSDSYILNTTKNLIEIKVMLEVLSRIFSTSKYDNATISEFVQTAATFYRSFVEQVTKSETFSKLVNKQQNETINTAQVFTKGFSKAIVNGVNSSEYKTFSYFKQLLDTVDATDDFYGETNVDDDQIATVSKTLADSKTITETFSRTVSFIRSFIDGVSNSEIQSKNIYVVKNDVSQTVSTIIKSLNKVASESVHPSETKTANIQSYFLSDYVVPGYVGINYTL